jgi:hypothetical protein
MSWLSATVVPISIVFGSDEKAENTISGNTRMHIPANIRKTFHTFWSDFSIILSPV